LLKTNQDILAGQALKPHHILGKKISSFVPMRMHKHPWNLFKSSCGTCSSELWKCYPVLNG